MKSIIVTVNDGRYGVSFAYKDKPKPGADQCLVKLHAAALNRRDYWISVGKYPGIKDGVTLGSDGCGEVVAGDPAWVGKTVLINPNQNWGHNPEVQSSQYTILGMPEDGTLAGYLSVPTSRLVEKPTHLSAIEGAALPLAGLTAYRAVIRRAQLSSGSRVLITGIGGGVSQFALAFATALGAEVFVSSSSEDKIAKAVELGAAGGFNYKDIHWVKEAADLGKYDAIIDSAGGNAINDYLKLIKPGGNIVIYGSTTGKAEGLDLFRLFWSQAALVGSTMGNDEEFVEMISFVNKHKIRPVIDQVYPFAQGLDAIHDLGTSGSQIGKLVIEMEK